MKIGIAGLGLIGGSMAKAAGAYTEHEVIGYDKDEAVLKKALCAGDIQRVMSREEAGDCDILLVALYPSAAVEYIRSCMPYMKKELIIVDLCGVKKAVMYPVSALSLPEGVYYFGGHPMAGLERSGYDYAKAELFRNAPMILVPQRPTEACEGHLGRSTGSPSDGNEAVSGEDRARQNALTKKTEAAEEALKKAEAFFYSLGFGSVVLTTAEEHDRVIAFTSQLAHVVSSAYVKSPTALKHYGFSAGSYKDLTRVARLNETMWTELFLDNAESLAEEIDGLILELQKYRSAIAERDRPALFQLLREGRERKERIDSFENS